MANFSSSAQGNYNGLDSDFCASSGAVESYKATRTARMHKLVRHLMYLLDPQRQDTLCEERGLDPPGVNVKFAYKNPESFERDREAVMAAIQESVRSGRASAAIKGHRPPEQVSK